MIKRTSHNVIAYNSILDAQLLIFAPLNTNPNYKRRISKMRYSKRPRPSLLRTKFQGVQNMTSMPTNGQIKLLKTHIQEESRRTVDLRTTMKHIRQLIEQESSTQARIKQQIIDLTTRVAVQKRTILIDPMFFVSRKIPEEQREFVIKASNTILKMQQDTKQKLKQLQPKVTTMSQKIKKVQEQEESFGDFMKKMAEERLRLNCSKTIKNIELQQADQINQNLSMELKTLEDCVKTCNMELQGCRSTEQQLQKKTDELSGDIQRYNEEIEILEEGAANQNECARRMIQMELLVKQQQIIQQMLEKQIKKRRQLTNKVVGVRG